MADPRQRPPSPQLQTVPTTWDKLAGAYADLYTQAKDDRRRMTDALEAVPYAIKRSEQAIVEKIMAKVDGAEGRMLAAVGELSRRIADGPRRLSDPPARSVSPQPRSYNLRTTDTGSVKLDDVKDQLDALDDKIREAEAREEGAKQALMERAEAEEAFRKKLAWYGAAIAASASALAWLASHFLHL